MGFSCGLFHRRPARQSVPAANAQGQQSQQGQQGQSDLQDIEYTPRTSYASSHNEEITTTRQHAMAGRAGPAAPQANVQNPELAGYYSPPAPRPAPPPRPRAPYRPPQELSGFYSPGSSAAQPSQQGTSQRQAPLVNQARNPKPTMYT
ncbi:hypothetical protein PFICI_06602 [Pestalotiopsis fici W106-1]|uniref:Uncharacterized protein n=1 Tax=Pestalotiopsis fici (strain W106-1 / CGMCC3.15140) TaxID=1229662 RepID=W3X6C7_PESFW|nr:uncharacterized protein PFICI_06602 [Pestalotiopsis fici W106-1]ETS81600.1 hypothetical protein PFICI_06602 [Pestalotiopsis fici W106-1]